MTDPNEKVNGEIAFDQSGIAVGNKGGLTKREYFAAMAMQGLCANGFGSCKDATFRAVGMADALIQALNKEPSNE